MDRLTEVVRCKEYKHYINTKYTDVKGKFHESNWFCELFGRCSNLSPTDFCSHGKEKESAN